MSVVGLFQEQVVQNIQSNFMLQLICTAKQGKYCDILFPLSGGPLPTLVQIFDKIWAKPGLFLSFLKTMTSVVKNLTISSNGIDGVFGIRTPDRRMLGTDKSTEL